MKLHLPALLTMLMLCATPARGDGNWPVDTWAPPLGYAGTAQQRSYEPLKRAAKPWRICASYPHLKDSYWLSVNYGMVEHARRLGVSLKVVEAGGYPNLERQKSQIAGCVKAADVLIGGTVSFGGLTPLITGIAARRPVVACGVGGSGPPPQVRDQIDQGERAHPDQAGEREVVRQERTGHERG